MSNYTLWQLFGPVAWPVWLLGVGLLSQSLSRRARPFATAASTAALLALLLFGVLPAGFWLLRPLELRFTASPAGDMHAVRDIVVLTGAERLPSSALSGRLETGAAGERVLEAVALARRLPSARLWVTGGVSAPGYPVKDVAWTADAWIRAGVAPTRIRIVSGTADTCGNAAGFARAAGSPRPLLVTSAFHMPRAVACFRAAGLDPLPYPVDYQTWPLLGPGGAFSSDIRGNLERADLALHEWLGLALYRLEGRTDTLWPPAHRPEATRPRSSRE